MQCNRATLLCLVAASLASAYTFRGDNRRSGFLDGNVSPPLIQTHTLDIGATILSSPVVVNDTVYFGARDSCAYAVCAGRVLWKYRTRGWVDASPAYYGGKLYVGSRDGLLYVLNAATGDSLLAIFNGSTQCSSPLLYDTLVVFGAGGWAQDMRAHNVNTGFNVWFHTNPQMVYSSAALADSLVVYGENGGNLAALNAYDGRLAWKYRTRGGVYLSTPAISEGRVYFSPGDYDPYVYCISLEGGLLLWKHAVSAEILTKPLNKRLVRYFTSHSAAAQRRVLARVRKAGMLTASQERALRALAQGRVTADNFPATGGAATSSVAADDKRVYVIRMEYGPNIHRFALTAFDKFTGDQQWTFAEARTCQLLGFCSSPIVVDSVVFFGWGEGKVYALHAETGAKLWEDSLSGDILSSPAAANGKVYFATTTGQLVTYSQGPDDSSFSAGTFCYPNPARRGDVSSVRVSLQKPGTVNMTLYNMADKPVVRVEKVLGAGIHPHFFDWRLDDVANGVYFARIKVTYAEGGEDKKTVKIAVLK